MNSVGVYMKRSQLSRLEKMLDIEANQSACQKDASTHGGPNKALFFGEKQSCILQLIIKA